MPEGFRDLMAALATIAFGLAFLCLVMFAYLNIAAFNSEEIGEHLVVRVSHDVAAGASGPTVVTGPGQGMGQPAPMPTARPPAAAPQPAPQPASPPIRPTPVQTTPAPLDPYATPNQSFGSRWGPVRVR